MSGASRLEDFVAELKRRRVFRVAAGYAVAAYVILQAAQLLLPALLLPGWVYRFLVIAALLGFPIALALAWAFDIAPAADAGLSGDPETSSVAARSPLRVVVVPLVIIAVVGVAWIVRQQFAARQDVDANLVAVAPFRTSGADASLAYLHEGLVDLLSAKLSGESGPHAVDPRSLLSAWKHAGSAGGAQEPAQEAALEVARSLGSGRLLLGEVVGTHAEMVISARLLEVPGGRVRATASARGAADHLTTLVDSIAATLLSLEAGENQQRLLSLTSASLPALRSFLEGRALYRGGHFPQAADKFAEALQLDTTFVLAAFGIRQTVGWRGVILAQPLFQRAARVAWGGRDRLGERDRAVLLALLGPNFPRHSSEAEMLAAGAKALDLAPADPEIQHWLADKYFHYGALMGYGDWLERAERGFVKSVELDSALVPSLSHLVQIAMLRSDTAAVRKYGALWSAADTSPDVLLAMRWARAAILRDTGAFRALRASYATSRWVLGGLDLAEEEGIGLSEVPHLYEMTRKRPLPPGRAAALPLRVLFTAQLNLGKTADLARVFDAYGDATGTKQFPFIASIMSALYNGGDTVPAARLVKQEQAIFTTPLPADAEERAGTLGMLCMAGQWRLWHRDMQDYESVVGRLSRTTYPQDSAAVVANAQNCAVMLSAIAATVQHQPNAHKLVERLDSLRRTGQLDSQSNHAHLVVSRLYDELGDAPQALAALERVQHLVQIDPFGAARWREHGRLAALAGKRDVAIHDYRIYLALRYEPDPVFKPEVERVRKALAELTNERAR